MHIAKDLAKQNYDSANQEIIETLLKMLYDHSPYGVIRKLHNKGNKQSISSVRTLINAMSLHNVITDDERNFLLTYYDRAIKKEKRVRRA